ncbi:MAG TPA: ATP-binding protein [Chloroflexota bacterium]|nr:ATP-binding protein [Chloroflexota bacterium]
MDDDAGVLLTLEEVLKLEGFRVTTVSTGEDALAAIAREAPFDVILTDLRIQSTDGVTVLSAAHERDPSTVCIVLTGFASMESAIQALRHGASNYLLKPCNLDELKLTIRRGLERKRLSEALHDRVLDLEAANETIRAFSGQLEERVRAATAELAGRVQEAQESRRTLSAIIDSMSDGLLVYDDRGRVVLSNAYVRALFQMPEGFRGQTVKQVMDVTGEPPLEISQPDIDNVTHRDIRAAEFSTPGASPRDVRRVVSRVAAEDGTEIGLVVVYQDITERREVEKLKDDFLSIASHELKTPLTSILGYTQLLLRRSASDMAPSGGDFLRVIEAQSQRMKRLVDDLLDVSRIERRSLNVSRVPVDVVALAEEVVRGMKPTNPSHAFVVSVPSAPLLVLGDPDRLQQVIANLLSNAVKYSPDGGEVRVAVHNEGNDAAVEVRDEGIGIPADQLPHIFSRFFQAAPSVRSRRFGGMGLGLYISKGIIDELGGQLEAESTVGLGSCFRFTLPRYSISAP